MISALIAARTNLPGKAYLFLPLPGLITRNVVLPIKLAPSIMSPVIVIVFVPGVSKACVAERLNFIISSRILSPL